MNSKNVSIKEGEIDEIGKVPVSEKNPSKEFDEYLKTYLDKRVSTKVKEFEIRFGTVSKKFPPITKINYNNVVQQLYAAGFKPEVVEGYQMLKINPTYVDKISGLTKTSNVRVELKGDAVIQKYCQTNSLRAIIDTPNFDKKSVLFTMKTTGRKNDDDNGAYMKPLDFDEYNFRVSYQYEQTYYSDSRLSLDIIKKWEESKKVFRSMNRVRFRHPDIPIFADISIVKCGKKTGYYYKPQYTIQEAGVFESSESYDIELEIDNRRVGLGTPYENSGPLMDILRKTIRIVLSGLQNSNYPISYSEQQHIMTEYMKLIHGHSYELTRRITSKDFIGPSSKTLQLENITEIDQNSHSPNIRKDYTVTDKADGDRKLLYISQNGRIYFINTNMNIAFTGMVTHEKPILHSLIDGEHIRYDKMKNFIHLYAAFDIYYIRGKSVRDLNFVPRNTEDIESKFRLPLLAQFIDSMKLVPLIPVKKASTWWMNVGKNKEGNDRWMNKKTGETRFGENPNPVEELPTSHLRVQCKKFYMDSEDATIFQGCNEIITQINDGLFEYQTDGLIFTPASLPVSGTKSGEPGPVNNPTWELSFKWKPMESNTIDFLVTVKKEKGRDEIHHLFTEGLNTQGLQEIQQYKPLILMCGFDEKKHRMLNPYNDIIQNNLPSPEEHEGNDGEDGVSSNVKSKYEPRPFVPSNPYDPYAYICNILLKNDGKDLIMTTADGDNDYFEEDMIVEFRYDAEQKPGWRWIPIRVRYDKTNQLRNGGSNYGNAYHVANNNWQSIHYPITEKMICGEGIPEIAMEDIYYHRKTSLGDISDTNSDKNSEAMRNFHNLYVKSKLIQGVAHRNDTLIDYAVGQGGDIPKWIHAKLGFVLGMDVSKDNIHNPINGVCARYLNYCKKFVKMPAALFVNGNSTLNIRTLKAFEGEKDKQIVNAVFGNGPKDATKLGEGVYKQYGVAKEGFQISSCQFAIHYFFENAITLNGFLSNLAQCTAINGYFIGTCFDGNTIFQLLKDVQRDESIQIMNSRKNRGSSSVTCKITKLYNETSFPDDDLSLGYGVAVCQDTINKDYIEYLVQFDYLVRILEDYGFVLVSKETANNMGLPNSTGMFSELFLEMEEEIKRDPKKKSNYRKAVYMTDGERQLSFMNRYFVFQKVRTIDADKVSRLILRNQIDLNYEGNLEENNLEENIIIRNDVSIKIKRPRKQTSTTKKIGTDIIVPETKENEQMGENIKIRKRRLNKPKIEIEYYSPIIESPEIENNYIREENNKGTFNKILET
jgi:hypothetical protein